ncbi:MAG: hypothetical protein OXI43_13925 [Candidatus Poribacteria bacterium]|nr:hypothetical protein [Candidatus Poribacteria bacterium]
MDNYLSRFLSFAKTRFVNMGDRENVFQQMSFVGNEKYPEPLSDKFIFKVQYALQSKTMMQDRLRQMFIDNDFLEKANQIHWELSRIPVIFEYHQPVTWSPGVRHEGAPVFDHLGIRIQESDMPADAAYFITTKTKNGFVVCFFETSQAKSLRLPLTDVWRQGDIVKTLYNIAEGRDIVETGQPVPIQQPVVNIQKPKEKITAKTLVYNFIDQNSPVSYNKLLKQKFCQKSQLVRILQSLVEEKKIRRPKRGIYQITNY